ncbi:hypothetical protein DB346_17635 [Verrucomicrobia bacterium LW23]|nr:hypothetical protein DB346_17635 [Verrucomicrobia bacterium LW23]
MNAADPSRPCPRPNILHLFTDQQRFDTIAALGNPIIRTPHMDRLVREGTAFERAYSPSPECVPARCAMITGRYPGRTGCHSNGQGMGPDNMPTLMSRLAAAGYRTHGVGKCHFTPNCLALRGFHSRRSQEEIPESRESDDYARWLMEKGWGAVLEPHGVRGDMYYVPQPSAMPEAYHPTRWVGDESVAFLDEAAGRPGDAEPWYLYASFVHPHPPFAPPIPWHKLYRAPQMPLPDLPAGYDDALAYINRFQNRYKYRDRGLDLNLIRCIRAYYYACISFIDAQVGRILHKLELTGQLDNTLVLLAADHGEYLGDYGCFGKRGIHEVSSRVPLLARWPGGAHAGTRCSRPASLVDLAPTFMHAAGIECEADAFDGVSLRTLLETGRGNGEAGGDRVYSQYNHGPNGLYMAVDKRWKYGYSAPDGKEFLFDLAEDPREHINLASRHPGHPALAPMRTACLQWAAAQGQAAAALDGDQWRQYPHRSLPDDPDAFLLSQDPPWWDKKLPEW